MVMPSLLCSCVHGARLHVKALTSAAACSRSRCVEVAGRIRLDGRCAAEGKHLFVVLSFAACIALRTQLRPSINVLPHTPCDARRQRTARSSSSACVVLAGVSPLLLIPLCSPCWIVPPPPSPNKARPQPPCRQLLSGPGGSGLHGGASAASAVQQMQKREKSFGKMLTLRFGMYGGHVSCVFSVLCDGKLQRLCVEGDVSRSDPLLL